MTVLSVLSAMLLLNDFSNAFKVSVKEDMSCERAAKRCTVEDSAPFQQVLMGLRLSRLCLTPQPCRKSCSKNPNTFLAFLFSLNIGHV